MQYDFDQIIDRSNNHAAKYDERKKKFGTDDVIPSGSRKWISAPASR